MRRIDSLMGLLFFVTTASAITVVTGELFVTHPTCQDMALWLNQTYHTVNSTANTGCARVCTAHDTCRSFLFDPVTLTCHLSTELGFLDCSNMVFDFTLLTYYEKMSYSQCQNGGYSGSNRQCICINGAVGLSCERYMKDCTEGMLSPHGYSGNHGIYYIQPEAAPEPFPVYCFMSWDGRTYILSRDEGDVDFFKNWQEYKDGFGDLTGDHWLGLESIHDITSGGTYHMTVQLDVQIGLYYQQIYQNFRIDGENGKFRMTFSYTYPQPNHELGDCLTPLNGSYFSTYDNDNDNSTSNCAGQYESGWWFHACSVCNPTGSLLKPTNGQRSGVSSEAFWTPGLGNNAPFKVEMWLVRA